MTIGAFGGERNIGDRVEIGCDWHGQPLDPKQPAIIVREASYEEYKKHARPSIIDPRTIGYTHFYEFTTD
jgi:hypothetical protein